MITSIALYPAPVGHWTSFGCEMSTELLEAAGLTSRSKVTARAGGWQIVLADDAGWGTLHELAPALLDALRPSGGRVPLAELIARSRRPPVWEALLIDVRPDRFRRLGCETPEDVAAAAGLPQTCSVTAGAARGFILLADKVPWKRLTHIAPLLVVALETGDETRPAEF